MKIDDQAPDDFDLEPQDRVRIKAGPFKGFQGVVDEILSAQGRVRVIVEFRGLSTPVDVDYQDVERV
jgi:transcriptional antiterminator NusG